MHIIFNAEAFCQLMWVPGDSWWIQDQKVLNESDCWEMDLWINGAYLWLGMLATWKDLGHRCGKEQISQQPVDTMVLLKSINTSKLQEENNLREYFMIF